VNGERPGGGKPRVVGSIWAFMGLYLALLPVGDRDPADRFMGVDLTSSFFTASIACLGNIGPGLGQRWARRATTRACPWPPSGCCRAAMVVGRLEIYTVLVVLVARVLARLTPWQTRIFPEIHTSDTVSLGPGMDGFLVL
jgi:Trk-type K+ transport system membrane component